MKIKILTHLYTERSLVKQKKSSSFSLATGTQVGVIEVVRDAKTVYKIQQESSRLAGKRNVMFQQYLPSTGCLISELVF